jgi:glycosyltransferase involved in cell wall biosynthesis
MDIYGDPIAENQALMFSTRTNRGLYSRIRIDKHVLKYGDVFSTCGIPQKYALIGKLAHLGRLGKDTFGYDFAYEILPGVELSLPQKNTEQLLRGKIVQPDDFIVLWCGGYNVWTDVKTLFDGLEYAMQNNHRIKFVSVGGPAVDDKPYQQFLALINNSCYKDNFKMLGWKPHSEVKSYYQEADVGISIDKYHYETLLGTRTRLTEMMGYNLPVITTLGCELSYILKEYNAAITFPIGDYQKLGEGLIKLADSEELKNQLRINASRLIKEKLSFEMTTKSLRNWVNNPYFAADKINKNYLSDTIEQLRGIGASIKRGLKR